MSPAVFAQPWDYHKYIYIAENGPLNFHIAPFCWRFLHPLIAGALPWPLDTSFRILSLAEALLGGVLAYYLSRAAGFSQAAGLTALIVFFGIPPAAKDTVFNPWGVDPLSRVLVLAGFLFLVKDRLWLACAAFALGVCAKETVVITAPLFYAWKARKWFDREWLLRSAALALPIIATFVAVRIFIPAWNADPEYVGRLPFSLAQVYDGKTSFVYSELIQAIFAEYFTTPAWGWMLMAISVGSFGVFAVLPFLAWRANAVLLLRLSPFLLLTYVAMLFSSGWTRVLVLAFPAVALLALRGLHLFAKRTGAPELLFTAAAAPISLLTFFEFGGLTRHYVLQFLIFLLALGVAAIWPKLRAGETEA